MPISTFPQNLPVVASGGAVAPVGATVIADTGGLNVGIFDVEWQLGSTDPAGVGQLLWLEHRDAANATTLDRAMLATPGALAGTWSMLSIAQGERIRALSGLAAAAGSNYAARISATQVS